MNSLHRLAPWAAGLLTLSALSQSPALPADGDARPPREERAGRDRHEGGEFGGREGGPGRGGPRMVSPVVQALDADGDGILSAAEIANAPAALKKLDKNGDGKIDREEMRPAQGLGPRRGPGGPGGADTAERLNQMMAYDKNGDGKLAASELPERLQAMIQRADADKDGFVSRAEMEAFLNRQAQSQGQGPGGPDGNGRRRPAAE